MYMYMYMYMYISFLCRCLLVNWYMIPLLAQVNWPLVIVSILVNDTSIDINPLHPQMISFFVGSILIACAHYGGYIIGSDIDWTIIHGRGNNSNI